MRSNDPADFGDLAERAGAALLSHGALLVTAESCTGGWVAELVTSVAGSSGWFDRAFVTYSNQAKQDMLGVSGQTLERHGAVSEATVREMALGALARSPGSIAVAISGIAGPGGGSVDKPVGTVCFAWASKAPASLDSVTLLFPGDRAAVRAAAVQAALEGVIHRLVGLTRTV